MGDRRFELRVPRADPVDLRWEDQAGEPQHAVAQLANISPSGASVQSERPLKLGSTLSLGYQNKVFVSTVKHCVKQGAVYLLGIEFQPGNRWSPRSAAK